MVKIILTVILLTTALLYAADPAFFVTPGIKIGFRFGRTVEFCPGIEISGGALFAKDDSTASYFTGLVIGFQLNTHRKTGFYKRELMKYIELEGGYMSASFSAGAALGRESALTSGTRNHIRVFGGYLGYAGLIIPLEEGAWQVDAGLKYPFIVSGTLIPENKLGVF